MKPKTSSYEEKVKKIVDDIMNEKNHNPRDSTFRYLQGYHAEAQHNSLRYPGEFVKSLGTETFTVNNRNLRMDGAELVNPDKTLPYQSTINPEQQTTPVTPDKKDSMYNYKLQLIFKHKRPALNVVVTNIGDEDHTVIYESHGDAYKVYVRVFSDKEISQRLNTLKDNIKNKKELSEIEVLDFAYILMFAQENKAKAYTQDIAELFKEVKYFDMTMQFEIHYVLKKLIRLHFRDDKNKTRELLTMITKAIHPDAIDNLTTFEKMAKKVEIMDNQLTQRDDEINSIRKDLSQKDEELSQKDEELSQKEYEIRKLKNKLEENNIKVDF